MKKAKIFLINKDKNVLIPVEETEYEIEDELQGYLASYPDLLPGDQINPENPRRWLLVAREMGVPGEETGGDRWSLDHLFLDQDGTPTFVECKRSSDTRNRREVVAQMLDYAANGIQYWPIDRLRQAATETAQKQGKTVDDQIANLLQLEAMEDEALSAAVEEYWSQVEAKLRAGKIRLVFVADETPRELRRLVEFLNEKMRDVEVLAVEMKQFLGKEAPTVLVPRVIGLTETARAGKDSGGVTPPRKYTTREEFMAKCPPQIRPFLEQVVDRATAKGHTISWGTVGFSARATLPDDKGLATFVLAYPNDDTTALFDFYFGPFPINETEAKALREKLMAFGLFKQSGQKTLRATLKEGEDLGLAYKVYDFILEEMERILGRSEQNS